MQSSTSRTTTGNAGLGGQRVARTDVRFAAYRTSVVLAGLLLMSLTGCGGGPSGNGDPGARPLPLGATCQSLKTDLDRMVGRGVQNAVEAEASGRKQSAQQKADADRYNTMLNQYLGARCHV